MKTTKLKLNKFRIAKLTGSQHIMGGDPTSGTCDPTDPIAPQLPGCILTSKEVIDPDPEPTTGNGGSLG